MNHDDQITPDLAEPGGHICCYHAAAVKSVLADRERELLLLKGRCSNRDCRLHYAHSGPCDTRAIEPESKRELASQLLRSASTDDGYSEGQDERRG